MQRHVHEAAVMFMPRMRLRAVQANQSRDDKEKVAKRSVWLECVHNDNARYLTPSPSNRPARSALS